MESEKFMVEIRLRQGDPLSTVLFNLVLEPTIRKSKIEPNGTTFNKKKTSKRAGKN